MDRLTALNELLGLDEQYESPFVVMSIGGDNSMVAKDGQLTTDVLKAKTFRSLENAIAAEEQYPGFQITFRSLVIAEQIAKESQR